MSPALPPEPSRSRRPATARAILRALSLVVLVVALGLPVPARASLAYDLDVEALTAQAELVARAQVVSRRSRWSQDGRRLITETVLRVRGVLKGGPPGQELRVVQPGGALDGVAQHVSGAAPFEAGEDVLVFLSPRGEGAWGVVGMALGKYRVGVDRQTGRLMAFRDGLEGVSLLAPDGRPIPDAASRASVAYSELVRAVRAAMPGSDR